MKPLLAFLLTAALIAPLGACGSRGKLKTPAQIQHDEAKKAAKEKKKQEQQEQTPQTPAAAE